MKWILTFSVMIICCHARSQTLNGIVYNTISRRPIENALVSSGHSSSFTNSKGAFSLTGLKTTDSLRIICQGYATYYFVAGNKPKIDTLRIYLQPLSLVLKQVNIRAKHDYRKDSLKMRRDFAAVLAYKQPTVKDAFLTQYPKDVPYDNITARHNTTAILGVNVLSVIGLLNKSNAPVSKLQKVILKDEGDSYVDRTFSKQKVMSITSLKGDSLQHFMDQYRQSLQQLKKMNDYQLGLYIKKCYDEFLKTYKPAIYKPVFN
jgi:hypothetical protein